MHRRLLRDAPSDHYSDHDDHYSDHYDPSLAGCGALRTSAWLTSSRPRPTRSRLDEAASILTQGAWAVGDTTAEQGARLEALAASLRAAAQDLVETLGSES